MNTVFDFKQERSAKTFIVTLLSTITLLAGSTATLFALALPGNASTESSASYTGIAPTYAQTVAANQTIDRAGLVLFNESNLKGALK